jgi:hypothetical protein
VNFSALLRSGAAEAAARISGSLVGEQGKGGAGKGRIRAFDDLAHRKIEGKDHHFVLGSRAGVRRAAAGVVGVVGIGQGNLVGVAGVADDGFGVERRVVLHNDVAAGRYAVNLLEIGKLQGKTVICSSPLVLRSVNQRAAGTETGIAVDGSHARTGGTIDLQAG